MKYVHQYRVCPICGAHLDPGERCDCEPELEIKIRNQTSD